MRHASIIFDVSKNPPGHAGHCRPSHETVKRRFMDETISDVCVPLIVLQHLWTLKHSLLALESPDKSYILNCSKCVRAWTMTYWVFKSSCCCNQLPHGVTVGPHMKLSRNDRWAKLFQMSACRLLFYSIYGH